MQQDFGSSGSEGLTSVPGKTREQILLEDRLRHVQDKKVTKAVPIA